MPRTLWLLDDARTFGGGQLNALRLGRHIASGSTGWSMRLFCPIDSELGRRSVQAGIAVEDVVFPDFSPDQIGQIRRQLANLRRQLALVDESVVVVAGSLRSAVYAHTAGTALRNRPSIVQFMVEQDSAERRVGAALLRRYGAIVAIGGNTARAYAAAVPSADVIKINNFLLPAELAGRNPQPLPEGPPVVGVLARMLPEKGILELLEELAPSRGAWSRLLVAGSADDAAYAGAVEKRIESLGLDGSFSFLGHVNDVSAFMAQVSIVVVPSVGREGQPTVILDALANDRPVIVRAPLWSEDFEGLPVAPYESSAELKSLLATLPGSPVDHGELTRRFGPQQALDAFAAAAAAIREHRR